MFMNSGGSLMEEFLPVKNTTLLSISSRGIKTAGESED
jgi:hypothetical protein